MPNNFQSIKLAFKQNPALGFALLIGVIALLYIVYKQNSSTAPSTNSNQGNSVAQVYAFDITPSGPSTGTTTGATSPGTPTSGGGTGVIGTGGGNPPHSPFPTGNGNNVSVVKQGALATVYGGVHNGGRDLTTLVPGNTVTITAGPKSWGGDTYYQVNYGSQSGWVQASTIGK